MKLGDMDYEKLLRLFRALNEQQVDYVVVGAVALGLHGLVRATQDLDLFVRPSTDNVARLRAALEAVWPDPALAEFTAEDLLGEFAVVGYVPPEGDLTIDIIARLGEVFGYDDIEWQTLDAGGVPVRVATPAMLYRMKRDTVRPQDAADAHALRAKFGLEP